MKRFYKAATVADAKNGFQVQLDGRPLKTRGGAEFLIPTRALAEAVATEWDEAGETIDPRAMPLTRLAFTAIDSVHPNREIVVDEMVAFASSDLLSYRAEAPEELAVRQAHAWDPLLDWSAKYHGARLQTTAGISHVAQSQETLSALRNAVGKHDDFALAALHTATSLTGSLIIALAMRERRVDATEAFRLATVDETFQAEKWGRDEEAQSRLTNHASELAAAERFLRLLA